MHQKTALTALQQSNQSQSSIYSHRQSASQEYANSKPIHSATTFAGDLIDSTFSPQVQASQQQQQQYTTSSSAHKSPNKQIHHDEEVSQTTRGPYAGYMVAPVAQTTPSPTINSYAPLTHQQPLMPHNSNNSNNNNNNSNNSNNSNTPDQHMSKILAHSTSLLANDSYLAGMSSDSELTSGRHHHRPYSSQSRVYHAHPAPRNVHSSSRMSHYSDSAASYGAHHQQATNKSGLSAANNQQLAAHLAQQASISSAGSGGSASSSYHTMNDPVLLQQSSPGRPSSGRQLPSRPFKQSMSIDHHALGQYHHHHQPPPPHNPMGHMSSPAHSMSPQLDSATDSPGSYQSQLHTSSYPQQRVTTPIFNQDQRYGQRNLRLEMELLEKQTAGMSMYDKDTTPASVGLPPHAATRPSSSSSSSSVTRQLPPTNLSSMSVDHMHYQQLEQHYQPFELQQQHLQHHNQHKSHHQHQRDLYGSHQVNSAPSDWLPPIGPSGHHVSNRAAQIKQAMSIDHYPANQQHTTPNYNPSRAPQFTSDAQYHQSNFPYESPTHHQQQQQHSVSFQAQQPPPINADQAHIDVMYQYREQQPHLTTRPHELQQQPHELVQNSPISYSQSSARNLPTTDHKYQNLHHQMSSSSSNSQSGSLRSSNVDISKTMSDNQKNTTSTHFQQQPIRPHPGVLRKGYTSAISGLSSSNTALNEFGNLSSSSQAVCSSSSGPHRNRPALRAVSPSMAPELSYGSLSQQQQQQQHHNNNSSSSKEAAGGTRSESSTGLPNGSGSGTSNLTKKSNSATQLSMTGTKKRLGFRKKQVTSFSVHRSEEVAPYEARHLVKQGSSVSEGDSSMSGDSSSRSWSNSNFKPQASDELASMSFIDGLGKGQMISRQGLASPYLGDIQLSLCDRRGNLEIEVIRARNLQAKTNKILPLTYVKLYLVKNRKCLAKAKTTLSNKRTLDPLFQQQLTFHEDYHGCILQSIIWGNFGKMDKKNFMGIAQISIDDLELGDTVISWYKLFLPSSLQTLPSKSLRHTLLSNSTESFTNTNNS